MANRDEEILTQSQCLVEKPEKAVTYEESSLVDTANGQPNEDKAREALGYKEEGNAGFLLSVFNLMNAILGSGILGLSYAMAQLGFAGFFIICLAVAVLAYFAIHLLLKLCAKTGVKSYERLGYRAFGTPGKLVTAICILMQNIGAMSSYMFIIKNQLPSVLHTIICAAADTPEECPNLYGEDVPWYLDGNIMVIVVVVCVVAPLASLKSIEFLGYTSGFSISCMVFFTIIIVSKYFIGVEDCPLFADTIANGTWDASTEVTSESLLSAGATKLGSAPIWDAENSKISDECGTTYKMPGPYCNLEAQECKASAFVMNEKTVYAMPTMTFSFVCHTAILPIFAELKSGSHAEMQKVSKTSLGSCFLLYFIASLFGYFTFYNYVQSDLLLTYNHSDPTNPLTLVVRVCVLIGVILTLPLTHFPARKAVNFLFFPQHPFAWARHLGIMAALLTLCVTLVINVPDIREIFGFVGASASGSLIFILPSLFYIKIQRDDKLPFFESLKETRLLMGSFCFLVFGCIFSLLTLGIMTAAKLS